MKQRAVIFALAGLVVALGVWWFPAGNTDGTTVNVKMPVLSKSAQEGQVLFSTNCSSCHGVNGGGTENGPPLIHIIYEPSHHGDESFQRAVAQGTRAHHWQFGNMQPVDGITREDVAKIVVFVREVQRHNGID